MIVYLFRRLYLFVITALLLSVIGYALLRLDPNLAWQHQDIFTGWVEYLNQLGSGHLGLNDAGENLTQQIQQIFPATLELCFFAFAFSLLIGIPIGTIAGVYRGRVVDKSILSIAILGQAMPVFWFALLLILLFSLQLGFLPVSGRYSLLYNVPHVTGFGLIDTLLWSSPYKMAAFQDAIEHLILPTLVLSLAPTMEVTRLMRHSVAEIMEKNYIKVAQTKGLSPLRIIFKHTLNNAIPPIIPKLSMQFSSVMTLAMLTESIFNWPGIGHWLLNAIAQQDYPSIQAGVLAVGGFILIINILAEIINVITNPLIRKNFHVIE
jgi:cationic peptide transport system permease protein